MRIISSHHGIKTGIKKGLNSVAEQRLDEDGQPEKKCWICGDWWPADTEFYYPGFAQCKACYLERKYEKRRRPVTVKLTGMLRGL